MTRHSVLVFITILILINLTGAYYHQIVPRRLGVNEYNKIRIPNDIANVSINNVCESDKKCLWKCCPSGQHMIHEGNKECIPSKLDADFSSIPLYDTNFCTTNKSLESVFQLVPGIMSDKLFEQEAVVVSSHHIPYLIEDGKLYFEFPNLFERWLIFNTDHFCVDVREILNNSSPIFVVKIPAEQFTETVISETYALAVTIGFLLMTILPYVISSQLRDRNGKILIMFIIFFIIPMTTKLFAIFYEPPEFMKLENRIIGFCYYFTLISSFCWTNIMFYRFRQFLRINKKDDFKSKKKVWRSYCAYAFGLPLNVTIFLGVMEIRDLSHMPWFVKPQIWEMNNIVFQTKESLYYLYIPLALLLLYNCMICLKHVVRYYLESTIPMTTTDNYCRITRTPLNRATLYVVLLVLLTIFCITRVLEIMYPGCAIRKNMSVVYTMFIGPAIFITFVINRDVLTKQSSTKPKSDYPSPQWIWFKNGEDKIIFE